MTFHNLSLHFRLSNQKKKIIFNRLNYHFPDHGMIVITGDSGVGKSSLLKLIANIIKPTFGKVTLPSYSGLKGPLYLSDQLSLIPDWSVNDYLNHSGQQTNLKQLGFVNEDLNKKYRQLSIGQQVRLKVILFLGQPAYVYLLDEPTHALDDYNRNKLIEFLINQSRHKSIIIATHDQTLIKKADVEFNIQSAFKTSIIYQRPQSNFTNDDGMIEKQPKANLWPRWFRRLETLHRGGAIGWVLSIATSIVQIALFLLTTITFQMHHQWNQYAHLVKTDPWLEVVEIQTVPIHDSPFQLVKNSYPSQDSFNVLFQDINTALWLVDLSYWFPKTIDINNLKVNIRFIDLPFDEGYITTSWIYPKQTLPETLTLSTLSVPNLADTFTFSGPIHLLNHRPPLTWFEPPQLLLSYWQWLSILSEHKTMVENVSSSYFSTYLKFLPPAHALIYHSNHRQMRLLETLPQHPWRFTIPTEKAYPLIQPLMVPLLSFLPVFLISLVMIWMALWWSTLHWIYQQQRRHWQWMIIMHQSFKTIWFHLTRRVYNRSMIIHGVTLFLFTILMPFQSIVPYPHLIGILVVQLTIWVTIESLRLKIKSWFKHA